MDKWDARFMELSGTIATWASCYKANRKIGCVIVKDKRIMTTGYNGAPAGVWASLPAPSRRSATPPTRSRTP